jgi:hypothetical protein
MSLAAALLGILAARTCLGADIKCGACGSSPEEIIAKYGRSATDVVTTCGERSADPYPCRKLEYTSGIIIKEAHLLSFAKPQARSVVTRRMRQG